MIPHPPFNRPNRLNPVDALVASVFGDAPARRTARRVEDLGLDFLGQIGPFVDQNGQSVVALAGFVAAANGI